MTRGKVVDINQFGKANTSTDSASFSESIPSSDFFENLILDDEDFDVNMRYNDSMPKTTDKTINIFLATIAVTVAALAIIVSLAAWNMDKSIDAVNDNVNSKFETISTKIDAINQRLDYQEKLNSIQIQRDVANEVKNQKISK